MVLHIVASMTQIYLISAIFIAATFLVMNTPNMTMAYSCSSASSTPKTSVQTGVSGSSGSCSTSTSASNSPSLHFVGNTADGPNKITAISGFAGHSSTQGSASSSSGGAQSSCSSTTVTTSGGVILTQSTISKPGPCP
jgi:hypothetical protein